MNLNLNNLNFGAKYTVWGKQTPIETAQVYDSMPKKQADKASMAVQAQEYFETPFIQNCIAQLPEDTFVRLHTGVLDGENKKEDKVLGFVPFVSFETRTVNEQLAVAKKLNGGDLLKFSLDETGNLNKQEINKWFASILNYFS